MARRDRRALRRTHAPAHRRPLNGTRRLVLWRSRYALLAGLTIVLASCGNQEQPLNSWDAQGPIAEKINSLFWPVFWIAVAVFVLVQGALIVAIVVFRDRKNKDQAEPKQIKGNTTLELLWDGHTDIDSCRHRCSDRCIHI